MAEIELAKLEVEKCGYTWSEYAERAIYIHTGKWSYGDYGTEILLVLGKEEGRSQYTLQIDPWDFEDCTYHLGIIDADFEISTQTTLEDLPSKIKYMCYLIQQMVISIEQIGKDMIKYAKENNLVAEV